METFKASADAAKTALAQAKTREVQLESGTSTLQAKVAALQAQRDMALQAAATATQQAATRVTSAAAAAARPSYDLAALLRPSLGFASPPVSPSFNVVGHREEMLGVSVHTQVAVRSQSAQRARRYSPAHGEGGVEVWLPPSALEGPGPGRSLLISLRNTQLSGGVRPASAEGASHASD